MPVKIDSPAAFEAMGNKPILIEEYFGKVNSNSNEVSIAILKCPGNWIEPAQTPEFDEYTVVLKGTLRISTRDKYFDVNAGEAILTGKGERIQYSTPTDEGSEYVAVCLPAFSIERANREDH